MGPISRGDTDSYNSLDTSRDITSLQLKHIKGGRSQRGRLFIQPGYIRGGRQAKREANDARRELAWMDIGEGGIQLMKVQPLLTPTPYPFLPPTFHPGLLPHEVVHVQPQPQSAATSMVQDKGPTQNAEKSLSSTHRPLENYFKACY